MITEKVEHYGSEILEITYAPDDLDIISEKILDLKKRRGRDFHYRRHVGGSDDLTPTAIKKAGLISSLMALLRFRGLCL